MRLNTLLFLAVAFLILAPGCKKDKKKSLVDQIVATWDATSFTIDGVESIPTIISSMSLRFDKQIGGEGDTKWTTIYNPVLGLPTEISNGRYTINEARKEITLKQGSETTTLSFNIDGVTLTIEGTMDGAAIRIKAKK